MVKADMLLLSAPARIQECRTAEVVLMLRDKSGVHIPKSRVDVSLIQHAFKFGSNAFGLSSIPEADLQQAYEKRFISLFNYATLPFYWGFYEPQQGELQAEKLYKMAEWCHEHEITTKGHPLVWHEVYPQWAKSLPDGEILNLLQARVKELPSQFRERVGIWDVVNEATIAHRFDNAIGRWMRDKTSSVAVDQALHWARQSNPKAFLLYNDFNISPEFEQLITDLLEHDAPLDAIGIQSHMHQGTWPLERAWDICETYARFGLPLHFTELTILSGRLMPMEESDWNAHHTDWKTTPSGELLQAEYGESLYTLLYSHPAVQAITWWDFADYHAWQDAPAGFLREDMSPKPLYDKLYQLIWKDWATRVQLVSDDQANLNCRCTFGKHEVEVHLPSGHILRGSFNLEKSGQRKKEVVVS
jgi:endo-1,4-beta-xylanase